MIEDQYQDLEGKPHRPVLMPTVDHTAAQQLQQVQQQLQQVKDQCQQLRRQVQQLETQMAGVLTHLHSR
jgi:septal ring factor EnvC (AmiA/AmiB activator)